MKLLCVAVLGLLFVAPAENAWASGPPLRVMTFNIRFGTAPDGDNIWANRKDLVLKAIRDYDPDILGLQEALRFQLDAIIADLPHFTPVGVGREPNGAGEYSAVLFRRSRFDLCAARTFWLSATPNIPGSATWGNTLSRIATWVQLLDRKNDRRFWVFNTHWDHQSQPARLESGKLIARRLASLTRGEEPAIVIGDLNADERNPAIAAVTLNGDLLRDTYRVSHPNGPAGTFHGFSGKPDKRKIDYVLATQHWDVLEAEIDRTSDGRRFPSDHFPVTATIQMK